VESAPIAGADRFVEFIDQTMQAQQEAQMGATQNEQQQAEIERTKGLLENMKVERGMVNDEEKLRLEEKKIDKGGKSGR
jgi:hypothetical protein